MRHRRSLDRSRAPKEKFNINEKITASEVRVIDDDGNQLGILSIRDALDKAEEAGLDLVEVAPDGDPPVCKLIDYGKLKYKEQKKAAEARKRTATQTVKELRIRYRTEAHDLETKVRNARKFLAAGDRVRFQMRFRGREVVYRNLGEETFRKIAEQLEDLGAIEELTPLQGNRMFMTIAPK